MIHGPAYVASMLKIAVAISGYNMPEVSQPALVELTHQEMIQEQCCEVYGFYKDDEVIKVDPFLIHEDHLSYNSVVVHELTHWLQHHNGKDGFSCNQIKIREKEAYAVQNVYLMQYEHNFKAIKPPKWECIVSLTLKP